jgi:hypothetical protein
MPLRNLGSDEIATAAGAAGLRAACGALVCCAGAPPLAADDGLPRGSPPALSPAISPAWPLGAMACAKPIKTSKMWNRLEPVMLSSSKIVHEGRRACQADVSSTDMAYERIPYGRWHYLLLVSALATVAGARLARSDRPVVVILMVIVPILQVRRKAVRLMQMNGDGVPQNRHVSG